MAHEWETDLIDYARTTHNPHYACDTQASVQCPTGEHSPKLALDFTTRPARILLALLRLTAGIIVMVWVADLHVMPLAACTLLGLLVMLILGAIISRCNPNA